MQQTMIPPLLSVGREELKFWFKAEISCNVPHTDQNTLHIFKPKIKLSWLVHSTLVIFIQSTKNNYISSLTTYFLYHYL